MGMVRRFEVIAREGVEGEGGEGGCEVMDR